MLEDLRVKEVYTTVNDVTHKRAWLFHIMQDLHTKRAFDLILGYNSNKKLSGETSWYLICLLIFHNTAITQGLLPVCLGGEEFHNNVFKSKAHHSHVNYFAGQIKVLNLFF